MSCRRCAASSPPATLLTCSRRSSRVRRMANYKMLKIEDAPDIFGGQYPGEMRSFTEPLGNTQVAFTYRRMPAQTGGKGSYGHSHKTQEEVYFLVSGNVELKVDDEVLELGPGTVWRGGPSAVR